MLAVEIVAIVALLAAGIFLWQVQRTLRAELQWAEEAKASVNAYATATHGAEGRSESALPAGAKLQRVRIPALGIDYRLQGEALQVGPAGEKESADGSIQLLLPVEIYGDAVCGLDRLQPGDDIYLETVYRGFSFEVFAGRHRSREATTGSPLMEIMGYPCGDQGDSVLVSAMGISH